MSKQVGKRPRPSKEPHVPSSLKVFPSKVWFKNTIQQQKFDQLSAHLIIPNSYIDEEALKRVGLSEEVDFYIKRLGWEEWVLHKFPSYEVIIYEFLSLFEFHNATNKMSFRLGNEDFFMSIWEIKRALNMPIMFT